MGTRVPGAHAPSQRRRRTPRRRDKNLEEAAGLVVTDAHLDHCEPSHSAIPDGVVEQLVREHDGIRGRDAGSSATCGEHGPAARSGTVCRLATTTKGPEGFVGRFTPECSLLLGSQRGRTLPRQRTEHTRLRNRGGPKPPAPAVRSGTGSIRERVGFVECSPNGRGRGPRTLQSGRLGTRAKSAAPGPRRDPRRRNRRRRRALLHEPIEGDGPRGDRGSRWAATRHVGPALRRVRTRAPTRAKTRVDCRREPRPQR